MNLTCVLVINLCEELSHPKERAVIGCLFSISYDLGKLKWWSSTGFFKLICPRCCSCCWGDPRDVCYDQQLGVENSIVPSSSS